MKLKDLTYEKIRNFDPLNKSSDKDGFVTEWVARNDWGNAVAFGKTKAECVMDARRYVASQNGTGPDDLYIFKMKDGEYAARFGNEGDGQFLTQVKSYPAAVYYSRLDMNGSSVMEREICTDPSELLACLNDCGKCKHVVEQVGDFDISTCKDESVIRIFACAKKAKVDAIMSSF